MHLSTNKTRRFCNLITMDSALPSTANCFGKDIWLFNFETLIGYWSWSKESATPFCSIPQTEVGIKQYQKTISNVIKRYQTLSEHIERYQTQSNSIKRDIKRDIVYWFTRNCQNFWVEVVWDKPFWNGHRSESDSECFWIRRGGAQLRISCILALFLFERRTFRECFGNNLFHNRKALPCCTHIWLISIDKILISAT